MYKNLRRGAAPSSPDPLMDRVSRKSLVGDAVGSCYPGPGASHGNSARPCPVVRGCLRGGRPLSYPGGRLQVSTSVVTARWTSLRHRGLSPGRPFSCRLRDAQRAPTASTYHRPSAHGTSPRIFRRNIRTTRLSTRTGFCYC